MAVFDPVVLPSPHLAAALIAKIAHRSRIGPKPVGHDFLRLTMSFQRFAQELQSCLFVPLFRDIAFKNLSFVIDRPPQIMRLAVDLHKHLIEVPAPMAEALHTAHSLSPDIRSEHRSKAIPPQPHGLVTNVNSTLEQQILDVPKREREADVHHHDQADDLRR